MPGIRRLLEVGTRAGERLLWVPLALLASGCTVEAGSAVQPSSTSPPASVAAPTAVSRIVAALQTDYDGGRWAAIRAQFSDSQTATALLTRMRHWKMEQVRHVRTSLVYLSHLSGRSYVGTVQFAADQRAVPDYAIYRFSANTSRAWIAGSATGMGAAGSGPTWTISRTPHFVVYHSRYQLAGTDRLYLTYLEQQRAQFAREFGVSLPPQTSFYLYPDRLTMSRMTGGACGSQPGETGCARPFTHPPSIEAVIRAAYHEPIHIYELALAPPPSPNGSVWVAPLFIGEGTAVALENKNADPRLSDYCSDLDYAPLDECARIAIAHVKPLNILADSGFQRADAGYAYSLGGSFVKSLILRYGYARFGRFYHALAARPSDRISDYNAASKQVYHRRIEQLIGDWSGSLCRGGC